LNESNLQKVKMLSSFARELGVSLATLAICWVIKNPNVSTSILGASKISQLEESIKAIDYLHLLNQDVLMKIEDILANKPIPPQY